MLQGDLNQAGSGYRSHSGCRNRRVARVNPNHEGSRNEVMRNSRIRKSWIANASGGFEEWNGRDARRGEVL